MHIKNFYSSFQLRLHLKESFVILVLSALKNEICGLSFFVSRDRPSLLLLLILLLYFRRLFGMNKFKEYLKNCRSRLWTIQKDEIPSHHTGETREERGAYVHQQERWERGTRSIFFAKRSLQAAIKRPFELSLTNWLCESNFETFITIWLIKLTNVIL